MEKENILNIGIVVDNEWLDRYINLINSNLDTKREKYKTQKHHIIPRYYYKYNKLTMDNTNSNIVNLTYKDHILAHYYLGNCSTIDYYVWCNYNAIKYTLSKQNINDNTLKDLEIFVNSLDNIQEMYELAMMINSSEERRKKISECTKLAMQRPEIKVKLKNRHSSMLGKRFTEEHKSKISESNKGKIPWNKGKKMSEEYCSLHSICQLGIKHNLTEEGKNSLATSNRNYRKSLNEYKKIQCVETSLIYDFPIDAAKSLFPYRSYSENKIVACHILECCKNKRNTAYGFHWRYYE